MLIQITSNGSVSSPLKVVFLTDMISLNRADPAWRGATPSVEFDHYVPENDQVRFHVYPPSIGGTYCVSEVGLKPNPVHSLTEDIALDDRYVPIIANYVAAKASEKDTDYSEQSQAIVLMNQFYSGLKSIAGSLA